ncbi:MAG: hypothetical protein ACE5K8_09170, partial [Candidatus Zixiibacteriota bacterium]
GVIVIGVPLLLEPVKIICPSPGPAVAATGPFGKSTSFQDVLDELELELLQIAEELTNSIISSAANALGKRFENLLIDGAQTGVVNALDEFFEFTGTGRRVFSDFLMTSFKFLDEQVIAAGDTLGVSMEPFSPVAAFFDDDYEDSAKLREDIKNGIREAVLKGLTGSKDPWTSASPLFAAQYPESATARLMIGRAAEKFTDKLTDFLKKRTTRLNGKISQALSSSPAVPDATTAKTVKQTVKDEVLAPVRDQINKEIQHAVAEMELTSLGSDVEELAQEAADALAEWLYEDVVVGLTMDAYKSLAKKTNEGMADFFDTIFDPGSGFQFGPGLATMGQELGEEMADTVADTLETAISAIPGSENAFSNLADEIDFSLKELGNQALDIAEGVATRVMTKVAGMILNYGLLFDFEITHKDGMSGPGVLVDGYALVSILNEISSNMAGGGLSDMGLPDDGSSGGGIIIQGFVPSIFIFNRAVKNSALQDGAGVYFGEGFGALWLFNTVERNTAGNRGGGTFFDGGSISGFFFNEVDKNSAQLGGGGYLSSDASILFWNTFNANQSSTDGGGLAIDGDLLILYNDIVGNVASRRGGGVAVIERGDPSLWNNRISGNMGTVDGGGIAVLGDGTNPDIGPSNRIRENLTGGRGGGIFVDGFAEPEITGNRIAGNFAPVSGGGIYWAAPGEAAEKVAGTAETGKTLSQAPAPRRPDITSNLVLRNSTYGNGGGISLIQEFVPLANNRVMRNQARGEGGGVYIVNVNQASLSNNGLGSNMADGLGGGLRCDSVNQIVLSGNWFVGNLTGISGGGMAVDHAISVTSGSDAFEGNHAPLLGGGIWIENSGLLALT